MAGCAGCDLDDEAPRVTAPHPLLASYENLVASGALERDPAQLAALERLETLARELARRPRQPPASGLAARLRGLLGRGAPCGTPRGVYIHGLVGRGKTTLMDMFFAALPLAAKRRAHFHAFMADVHARLLAARRSAATDPLARVAQEIASETRVLCFDEFCVTDIADATILSRLFTALLERGVIMVATSNVEPRRLYEGGRNRDLFLPFIALIEERLDILRLDARADFRLEKTALGETFFTPADARARSALDAMFLQLTGVATGAPTSLRVARRDIMIPQAAGRVARFAFEELCSRPIGASDYMALAEAYDTIFIDEVPAMNFERRNEAKRFITLVDILYEKKTRLVLSAQSEAQELYRAPSGHEAQEFARTVSRLIEMRSQDYLSEPQTRAVE
ncbi:AFG1 family ATPase [Methylosinus sp. H3A]|uniref:cell division protein ZapE n=1 Tax=Methylosinus sp. H3A TaxID=2785786 RepID=UPI0018C2E13D|nr:cell division protein ZapE [Methylosinus sp. H3A]MBG0811626.1 AFG1 family ATPase [Methylosinus sp. H3A]